MIDTGLVAWLKADAAVSAITAAVFRHGAVPQGQRAPYITYRQVSANRIRSLSKASGLCHSRLEVNMFGLAQTDTAANLAEAVRTSTGGTAGVPQDAANAKTLQLFKGTMGGIFVHKCELIDQRDDTIPPAHDGEQGTEKIAFDLDVWFDEGL